MSSLILGIDLGTSSSCATVLYDGHGYSIPFDDDYTFPSKVYYNELDGRAEVGKRKETERDLKENYVYNSKRFLGVRYSDIPREIQPFNLKEDEDNDPYFEITVNGRPERKYPEDVAEDILQYIYRCVEDFSNRREWKVDSMRVCLCTPVAFTEDVMQKLRWAALADGRASEVVIVSEPIAAVARCVTAFTSYSDYVLVYDFGAGTFDITLVSYNESQFEVMDKLGDNRLGGNDVDNDVLRYVKNYLKEELRKQGCREEDIESSLTLSDDEMKKMLGNCRSAKETINSAEDNYRRQSYGIPSLFCVEGYELPKMVPITLSGFNNVVRNTLQRTYDLVNKLVSKHERELRGKEIPIILVGGSAKILSIRNYLNYVGGEWSYNVVDDTRITTVVSSGAMLLCYYGVVVNNGDIANGAPRTVNMELCDPNIEPVSGSSTSAAASETRDVEVPHVRDILNYSLYMYTRDSRAVLVPKGTVFGHEEEIRITIKDENVEHYYFDLYQKKENGMSYLAKPTFAFSPALTKGEIITLVAQVDASNDIIIRVDGHGDPEWRYSQETKGFRKDERDGSEVDERLEEMERIAATLKDRREADEYIRFFKEKSEERDLWYAEFMEEVSPDN